MSRPTIPDYTRGRRMLADATARSGGMTEDQAREFLRRARTVQAHPWLAAYLAWKYPQHPLLRAAGHTYPAAVFPVDGPPVGGIDGVLVRPAARTLQPDDILLPGTADYRAVTRRLGAHPTDGPCFCLRRLDLDPAPRITAELGSYVRALDTCDELAWELAGHAAQLRGNAPDQLERFDRLLSGRQALHRAVDDPVTDGRHRSAALAVSTLLAYRDGGGVRLVLQARGFHSLAAHQGLHHVAPSFMLQPVSGDLDADFSLRRGLEREYLEEFFGRPEPAPLAGDPCLEELRTLLESGRAHLRVTGVTVNLLNLRPEVCLLLFVDTPDWIRQHREASDPARRFRLNDEWAAGARDEMPSVAYCRDDDALLAQAGLKPEQLVPPGAAALWLGKWALDGLI